MKKEEKKPLPWEAVDPKPPVIRSGHMDTRVQTQAAIVGKTLSRVFPTKFLGLTHSGIL